MPTRLADAGSWGYSTNGEWFTTGFDSADEAFAEAIQYDCNDGLLIAFCTPTPLSFDVVDEDDFDEPMTAQRLVDEFLDGNADADYEGEAFEYARADNELAAADLTTPESCEEALLTWADRMGGFYIGRTLDVFYEQWFRREDVALASITPGLREYDWKKYPDIDLGGISDQWCADGVGLGCLLHT